jgi:glycosyltransferase involved in cell wall biosynthesis
MKIILIGPTYPFRGGISHYTTLLYKHLRRRHDTTLISFRRQYPKLLFPGRTDLDPSHMPIQESNVISMIDSMNPVSWVWTALRIVKMNGDLLILPWWVSFWAPQFWTIAKIVRHYGRSKILYLCHNVMEHESKWIDRILTRFVLKTGDLFIVHSTEDQQRILSMFPGAMVGKSHHPTYDVFNSASFDSNTVRRDYGIKGNIILFFGFVREYKGLKYLIEALPMVLSRIKVTLLVVGEFWKDKDQYLRLLKELKVDDKVIVIDKYVPNEEVGRYFACADLVVQPYVSATGSGVIQTAFGFNQPVIATNVGALPEVVEDGKTGYLVPPKSSAELAEAILNFFEKGKHREFSDNIKKRQYRFSWERMVDAIEELAGYQEPGLNNRRNTNL